MNKEAPTARMKVPRHSPELPSGSESIPAGILGSDTAIWQFLATVTTKRFACFGLCWGVCVWGAAGRVLEGGGDVEAVPAQPSTPRAQRHQMERVEWGGGASQQLLRMYFYFRCDADTVRVYF